MIKSYAVEDYSFGVRMIPQKLIENSNGTLQIYALHNNHAYPKEIENLVFSSTASSIVQVTGVENGSNDFIKNIKLKSSSQGNAKIELGASGFNSIEIPITVYGNVNYPTKLLLQSTPSTFSVNGPHEGYFTVELTNNDGSPATANNDILISLTTTDSRVLTLTDTQILIKTGAYYGVGKFEVKQSGSAQIFASTESLQSASSTITVIQTSSPTIQIFIYPEKINDYAASIGYVIAQLKDSSGVLSPASEDITIPVSVESSVNQINSSPIIPNIEVNNPIVIKKGSYWGYTNLAVRAAAFGSFNVTASVPNGYVNSGSGTLTTFTTQFYDDKSARLDVLPILATGKDELIGVVHLEDQSGNPIIASHDLQIEIDSSDPNALTVNDVIMNKGTGVALVFAKVGTNIPQSLSLHVVTYNDETVSPTISLPTSNSFNLVAQSLVPTILSHSNFPVGVYLKDSSGAITYFSNDSDFNVLANDYFSLDQIAIGKGDSIVLSNSSALKTGTSNLNIMAGNYQTKVSLTAVSSLSAQVALDYPKPMLVSSQNTMLVQIFDANSNPIYAQKDINLKLVSSNNQVLPLPKNIIIPKGQYYATLNVEPTLVGTSQVSIFADDLPLSTYQVTVDSMSPTLNLVMSDSISPGETFFATVTAQDHGDPLKNMKIQWKVNGAIIQNAESVTNQNGTAQILLLANSHNSVSLDSSATGLGYIPAHISKTIRINNTESNTTTSNSSEIHNTSQDNLKSFKINGMDPLPIIVLVGIVIGGILVKKKNILALKRK